MEEDLFEFVLGSGQGELKTEWVNCQDVLDEVTAALRSFAQTKGLDFEVLVPATPIRIHTDRSVLHRILLNLIESAITLTDKGSISVYLGRRLRGRFGNVVTEFIVEDSRPGMGPEEQARLFQRFKPHKGAQSGFPLSLKPAALLDGRVEMTAIPGQGNIFRVVIFER